MLGWDGYIEGFSRYLLPSPILLPLYSHSCVYWVATARVTVRMCRVGTATKAPDPTRLPTRSSY